MVCFCHQITASRFTHCQYNESVHRKEQLATRINTIRYRNKCSLCSRLLLRSDGFNAISPTECLSGGFKHKLLRSLSFLNGNRGSIILYSYTHRALHMFAEMCLRYNVIRVVNNSPLCILDKLNTHSLTGFANYAKHIFIQKYQDKCIIQNCYSLFIQKQCKHKQVNF